MAVLTLTSCRSVADARTSSHIGRARRSRDGRMTPEGWRQNVTGWTDLRRPSDESLSGQKVMFVLRFFAGAGVDFSGVDGQMDNQSRDFVVNCGDDLPSKSQLDSMVPNGFADELSGESAQFFDQIDQTGFWRQAGIDLQSLLQNRISNLDDLSADMPASLIVTSVPAALFKDETIKAEFESIFFAYDDRATFQYFRSFKRCRVNFTSSLKATLARLNCNELEFCGSLIRCFYAQIPDKRPEEDDRNTLKLPEAEKQFLISPPASPPVGWEQTKESDPVINFELVSRLTSLAKTGRGAHELHPRNESCPAIVLHTCGDEEEENDASLALRPKITQTKRPEFVITN